MISTQICRFYRLLRANGQNICYSGVNCALGPSKSIRYSGDFSKAGFASTFYCNSAGLSDVFRYNGVFVLAGFHCNLATLSCHLGSESSW